MNHKMQRVLVVGSSCAGKTTFSRQLAQWMGADHVELDALHWGPKWTPVDKEMFQEKVTEAAGRPCWVFDGNYFSVRDLIWNQATTLIWLDYSFLIVFSRAWRRTMRRVFTGERIYADNRESFRQAFLSRESILWWVISTFSGRRREILDLLKSEEHSHLRVVHFRRPTDAGAFIRSLKTEEG